MRKKESQHEKLELESQTEYGTSSKLPVNRKKLSIDRSSKLSSHGKTSDKSKYISNNH